MNKYPLDQEGVLQVVSSIVDSNSAQQELVMKLCCLLEEAVVFIGDDSLSICKKSKELIQSIDRRKMDFANLRFDQKNGHNTEKLSPYGDSVHGNVLPSAARSVSYGDVSLRPGGNIEREMASNDTEENLGEPWTPEELARHFGEPPPKKAKKEKEFSSMTLEEIKEWEMQQANSNDIYKISARVKNLARQDGLASLTSVGESLCNTYTHVLKALYDFAETISDREVKVRLINVIRNQESMPANFIAAIHANVKQ
jgi:hypothetical protein